MTDRLSSASASEASSHSQSVETAPNFHDFALQVSYICAMEEGGKLSQEKAFKKLKKLWKQLKAQNKSAA